MHKDKQSRETQAGQGSEYKFYQLKRQHIFSEFLARKCSAD